MRSIIRQSAIGLIAGLACLTLTATAYAHANLRRSTPAADATVSQAPERVDLWFSSDLYRRKDENWIRVSDPEGREASTGETTFDEDDRTHVWVNLRPGLPPGQYQVQWRNLSLEDGHSNEGGFAFTVAARSETSRAVTATVAPTEVLRPTARSATPTGRATARAETGAPSAGPESAIAGLLAVLAGGYAVYRAARNRA